MSDDDDLQPEEVTAPDFVLEWFRATYGPDADPCDLWSELAWSTHPEGSAWEEMKSELVGEEKYNNVNEVVLRHRESGRYILFFTHSLPYGITDYGMAPEEGVVVEVFPREVIVTRYETEPEQESRE